MTDTFGGDAALLCRLRCDATGNALNEIRGTWLTATANDAIAGPADTALTMRRLNEIGLSTVYVEVWKNAGTEFPSAALARVLGAPAPTHRAT